MFWIKYYRVSLILLACAAVCYQSGLYIIHDIHNWEPGRAPILMRKGEAVEVHFTPDGYFQYEFGILGKRTIPIKTLDCLLGLSSQPKNCAKSSTNYGIAWELSANGKVLVSGEDHAPDKNNGASWSQRGTTRVFHHMPLQAHTAYLLKVTPLNDMPELDAAEPQITVEVDSSDFEGYYFLGQFFGLLLSRLLIGIALVWAVCKTLVLAFKRSGLDK